MSMIGGWLATTRSLLEVLYFCSGIVIAYAAVRALTQIRIGSEQLRMTRDIANLSAKRESIKLASEQCRYYAERAIPLAVPLVAEYTRLKLTFLSGQPKFTIRDGEITDTNFDLKLLEKEFLQIILPLQTFLNGLEAFAIPFAAGVADDDLGFQETAIGFCQQMQAYMPAFFEMRRRKWARFESAVRLYDAWSKRLKARELAPVMKTIEELTKAAEQAKIKPIGD
ncbi:MAG: hypothetical protein WBC67_00655 [Candidatus Acidiferrales bacterium]